MVEAYFSPVTGVGANENMIAIKYGKRDNIILGDILILSHVMKIINRCSKSPDASGLFYFGHVFESNHYHSYNTVTMFLHIIHRPVFYLKRTTFQRLESVSDFKWNRRPSDRD
jgi:hypothetical protein